MVMEVAWCGILHVALEKVARLMRMLSTWVWPALPSGFGVTLVRLLQISALWGPCFFLPTWPLTLGKTWLLHKPVGYLDEVGRHGR